MADASRVIDIVLQVAGKGQGVIKRYVDELSGMDIGIGAMGSIGDRAWLDLNGNGMQDLEEPNMPGILIELYRNGELAASTTTDLYGRYLFSDPTAVFPIGVYFFTDHHDRIYLMSSGSYFSPTLIDLR